MLPLPFCHNRFISNGMGVIFTLYPIFFSMFESNDIDSLVSGALGYFYFREMLSL